MKGGKPYCKASLKNKLTEVCRSAVVEWLVYPPVTRMTRVQFPAAEFLKSMPAWKKMKASSMCKCFGGFGSGLLLLDIRKIRSLRPPRNPPFLHIFFGTSGNSDHMIFGGFGRGLLLTSNLILKLDLSAHPAILHLYPSIKRKLRRVVLQLFLGRTIGET